MTDTTTPPSSTKTSSPGIQVGFLLEMIGAAAVIGAAFFSPLPERIAVLAGVGAFAVGRFFPRITK
ncbi:MAG TPA: hypothetical protein VL099_07345 [Candidatus Binatia bacterium]|nr:hypothetical protein [Candidatus Binatia bacterium]